MTQDAFLYSSLEVKLHRTRGSLSHQFLKVGRRNGILTLTLDNPATRNAIGPEMVNAINLELYQFEQNPKDRVLLITGKDPSFCSGADVRRFDQDIEIRNTRAESTAKPKDPWTIMNDVTNADNKTMDNNSGALLPLQIHNLRKPSIAAINGHAIGVGMGLALACDIRLASENAIFSEAFVNMGLIPGDGSCWQLPRLIGLSHTFLLQYTGDKIDAEEAYRIGIVSKVYPHQILMSSAIELAERIARGPTYAMSLTKYLVQQSLDLSLEESLKLADRAQDMARSTEDHKEAVRAFLEKRNPTFQGK